MVALSRSYHQATPERPLIESHPAPAFVEERDVSDNDRSKSFTRRSTDTAEDRGTEERVVCGCFGSPDARGHRDDCGYDGNRASAEAAGERDPDEVREAQDQDGYANEVDDCW